MHNDNNNFSTTLFKRLSKRITIKKIKEIPYIKYVCSKVNITNYKGEEMNEDVKELINKLVEYNWDDELKHFNDEFNDTNIYWDTEQEIEIAITDNWADCQNHILLTLFALQYHINKGE